MEIIIMLHRFDQVQRLKGRKAFQADLLIFRLTDFAKSGSWSEMVLGEVLPGWVFPESCPI